MGKYFGTDGFRGEANVNLTVEHAYKVGRFLGWYYGQDHKAQVVIGKDTRRSSYMFEYSLVAGLTASGADVYLLHVTTTPSVSYVVRTEGFDCGIMISASHNPFYDNGIKIINGSGYKLARQAGHTIMPPQPSLCSLVSPDPACRRMMGLALRNVTLTLLCDGKPLFTEQGEALFTHFGLSGPLVLSASTYIEDITKHRYICEFDLKPALDEKTLYDRLTRDFAEQGSHSAQGALAKLLPNSMRPVAVEKWGIDPATKAAQITREQKQALVDLCKHWQGPVSALGDKEHAVITAGGVDVREVDPKTMASKLCAGLYFAGEVLDVDARTGGYNLQIAWSTAQAAVRAM